MGDLFAVTKSGYWGESVLKRIPYLKIKYE